MQYTIQDKDGETMQKRTLKGNYLIQKRNVFNELRANNMTLQELRFFSIYLSKINARDVTTRVVRFTMDDFKAIMELGRIDMNYMQRVTDGLLCKVVNIPDDRGGYTGFQIFKKCKVSKDDNGNWFVEIDAHDDALPLMFEFKNKYFTYQLWNALRLKSSNQLRMYEILKQYQVVGYRILNVEDLKALLGVSKGEYPRYGDFKRWVIDACQQALEEHTDIKFTCEPYGKKGPGGKILQLKFIIEKNEDYVDQLTLDMFIDEQKSTDTVIDLNDISSNDTLELLEAGLISKREDRLIFLREALNNEFTINQVAILYDIVMRDIPSLANDDSIDIYRHFMAKFNYMKEKVGKNEVKFPLGYLKSIIGKA
jgi:plasmid replication initiation protein